MLLGILSALALTLSSVIGVFTDCFHLLCVYLYLSCCQ